MNKLMMTVCAVGVFFMGSQSGVLAEQDPGASCIAKVNDYWKAMREQNALSVVALSSSSGVYFTNSDGSFHKPKRIETVERLKDTFAKVHLNFQVFFPEAVLMSNDVVLTRYYLEGLLTSAGKTSPYRTRVTQVWAKENGKWCAKSLHASSAIYGGVYVTQPADYDRD